jgi:anti-sigma factor RsiW
MRCEHVQDVLQDHLERLLLPIDRAAVDDHLAGCATCRREAASLRALVRALSELPDADVPPGFGASVMSNLPEMLPAQEGRGHLLRWGAITAALVFAFLASLSLLIETGGRDVARETLAPMFASLELALILLGDAASAGAALVDASATAIASASLGAKLAFALLFVAVDASFLLALARARPIAARLEGRAR